MALSDNSKLNVAFKKLIGKALTDTSKEGYNEANFSGVTVVAGAIPALEIPASPTVTALYDITQSGGSDTVELLRLPVTLDPTSNGKAYIAQLPAAYQANSSNAKAGTAPWTNNTTLASSGGKIQIIPPLYGALYEVKVYSGGTTTMGSGTLIAPGDARDWVFDYFNGILYQQTANYSPAINYVECLVYVGDMVSEVSGGSPSSDPYKVEKITLTSTDITNKYVVLAEAPTSKPLTRLTVIGGIEQDNGTDFQVTADDGNKRLSWNGLTLDGILEENDELIVIYS